MKEGMRDLSERGTDRYQTRNLVGQAEVGVSSRYCMKYPDGSLEPELYLLSELG